MKRLALPFILILALSLTACATATPANPTPTQPVPVSPTASVTATSPADNTTASSDLARSDEQGAVTVAVIPLNLTSAGDTLEFDIALNTHSVDLSMDLATLATLSTDTGITVQPTLWDAPRGGHHVEGKLIFPAMVDGKSILEGTSILTLTIANLDVPSRVFEWQLQ